MRSKRTATRSAGSTDSEVLVNLIEYIRSTNACSLLEAVQQALRQVVGAYAIAVVEEQQPRRDHRGAPEQPDGHRHRPGRVLSQLRRRVDHRVYAGFRLCERRGDRRHQPQQAAENRHAGQPRRQDRHQEAADEHFAARKGRLSAFHAQGDLRTAQDHRGLHPRPHQPRNGRGEAVWRDRQPQEFPPSPPHHLRGVRYVVARGADRRAPDREYLPDSGRGGVRFGSSATAIRSSTRTTS